MAVGGFWDKGTFFRGVLELYGFRVNLRRLERNGGRGGEGSCSSSDLVL